MALAAGSLSQSIRLLAYFLDARRRLTADSVTILGIHGLHILRDDLILTLLPIHQSLITTSMISATSDLRVQTVLISCGSLSSWLYLDRAYCWGTRSHILAIKTAIELHLRLILLIRPTSNIHIIQTNLTLMRFASNIPLPKTIVLLWAWQVLCFLLIDFLWISANTQTSGRTTCYVTLPFFSRRNHSIVITICLMLLRCLLAVVEVCRELNTLIHRLLQCIWRGSPRIVGSKATLGRQPGIAAKAATGH